MTDRLPNMGSILFLGTGASMGVPIVGCSCSVCKSESPYNKRLRPSALLNIMGKRFLIDCGPDFREQALRIGLKSIDGVLLTHAHHDHMAGLDELRSLYLVDRKPVPLLVSFSTSQEVRKRFHYLFDHPMGTHFDMQVLAENEGNTVFQGVQMSYFSYKQVGMEVNGFRIGDIAYVSDIRDYQDTIFKALKGVKTLVLSALRFTPSPMHFSVDEAVDFVNRVAPQRTFLMHISHELDHDSTNAYLSGNKSISLAYDGLRLSFSGEI